MCTSVVFVSATQVHAKKVFCCSCMNVSTVIVVRIARLGLVSFVFCLMIRS
jgi:hypothetical protein